VGGEPIRKKLRQIAGIFWAGRSLSNNVAIAMLTSICLRDFRSFHDTQRVPLKKLNILLGPNNAGKSAFLSGVELVLRSAQSRTGEDPLRFADMPQFASFDSVVRRHWSSKETRPKEFHLSCSLDVRGGTLGADFTCRGQVGDNTSYVHKVVYTIPGRSGSQTVLALTRKGDSAESLSYEVVRDGKAMKGVQPFFVGFAPIGFRHETKRAFEAFAGVGFEFGDVQLEVVNPHRPIPRSFYVLDDPALSKEDRTLMSFLIDVWRSQRKRSIALRQRILENMTTLSLVSHFEIKSVGKQPGPKIFEIKVAPTTKRHAVTIADVGFGVSQVLPLAVSEARLDGGYLIAYQPELHLHPYAQARLADIFIRSAARGNQIFVETHSVDLVLRLQALIAKQEIAGSDVQVLCVENHDGKSTLSPVTFDEGGRPTMTWPKGFLDTSLNLARELATSRTRMHRVA
jgi:hypothetical protein